VGGYFIGTSYDGKDMFNMLKRVKENESITIANAVGANAVGSGSGKIWEVTKRYNHTEFENNISCLGYGIDVYQESINKTFREYLVNYEYLTQLLENYGFVLLKRDELKGQPINESTGLFSDLFMRMNEDIKRNPRLAREFKEASTMTAGERQISFLNRYFIYKKVRKVDTENVFLGLTNRTVLDEKTEEDENKRAQEEVLATVKEVTPIKVKGKAKKNIKLVMED
jgi:hypothetical protein